MMLMMLALDWLLIGGPGQMMLMLLALGLAAYWRASYWRPGQMMLMMRDLDGLLIGGPGQNDAHDACP